MNRKIALALPFIALLIYLVLTTKNGDNQAYEMQLMKERRQKNAGFRTAENSPILPAQRNEFDSLNYYAIAPDLTVKCSFTRNHAPDTLFMPMSGGETEKYLRWGVATFALPGANQQELTLFQKANTRDSSLFVPFTDRSNGHETYGGGRYLDVPVPAANTTEITLDFNRAYNPYCAYNNQYSCPQPPPENQLNAVIPAGEKSFHD